MQESKKCLPRMTCIVGLVGAGPQRLCFYGQQFSAIKVNLRFKSITSAIRGKSHHNCKLLVFDIEIPIARKCMTV